METSSRGVVLLVDDDLRFVESLERLHRRDAQWLIAMDFPSAVQQLLGSLDIRAAVIDVHLSGRSGLDLVPAARERRPDLPILLITGEVQELPGVVNAAQRLGVELACKPLDANVVRDFLVRMPAPARGAPSLDDRLECFALKHRLPDSEREILRLKLKGLPNKEIADVRGVSLNTLKSEIRRLLGRYGAPDLVSVCQVVRRGGDVEAS